MTGKEAVAGDIVAVNGWKDAVSGEALSAPAAPLPLDADLIEVVMTWFSNA